MCGMCSLFKRIRLSKKKKNRMYLHQKHVLLKIRGTHMLFLFVSTCCITMYIRTKQTKHCIKSTKLALIYSYKKNLNQQFTNVSHDHEAAVLPCCGGTASALWCQSLTRKPPRYFSMYGHGLQARPPRFCMTRNTAAPLDGGYRYVRAAAARVCTCERNMTIR